ncbi:hypothetical protein N6L24_05390 [Cognatishimia sp. SS12]|uniref:hypothetical protein n=1 Tax=Cognatishimia sp. SS12 TaxID=2979465 RepID=UPI00232ED6C1|nr:hypothetical protein [Cognatishimia sp. SS12]MDC0737702.1 hypothetical protein [Cognatishimia sp. SS12]
MKRKAGMNLAAVIVAIIFMLVYSVPSIRSAMAVDDCTATGGRYDHQRATCN